MKKLSFVLAAAGLISLAACNKPAETANADNAMMDNSAMALDNAATNMDMATDNATNAMGNASDNAMMASNAMGNASDNAMGAANKM